MLWDKDIDDLPEGGFHAISAGGEPPGHRFGRPGGKDQKDRKDLKDVKDEKDARRRGATTT